MADILLTLKKVLIISIKYAFPTIAIIISILAYRDSRKANKLQFRINEVEEKIKKYELEEIEKEREDATKACVEASIIKEAIGKYKLRIWNSGKATASNVDFKVPEECETMVYRDKVPFEFLEPGKQFAEHVSVHFGTPNKFEVVTSWNDEQGEQYSRKQMVTI